MLQTTRVGALSVTGITTDHVSSLQLLAGAPSPPPPPQLSLLHGTTSISPPSPGLEDGDCHFQLDHHHRDHSPAGLHCTCLHPRIHSDASNVVFPSFLPPQVKHLRDSAVRTMASRIQRLPVQTSFMEKPIMTSCVKPKKFRKDQHPVLLLHGFDSSCLEWSKTYPELERCKLECWAVDILGWGFSCSEGLKSAGVAEKREHLYQFWRSYIQKPVILVGSSLGGAMAIDFCLAHPEAVSKLILINAQGYAEGTGRLGVLPKLLAYAGVLLLKSVLLRTYAYFLIHHRIQWNAVIDHLNVGRLHCCMPGWVESSVDFMLSGGYNIASRVTEVTKETLVIWGEQDRIISKDVPKRLRNDLPNVRLEYIKNCGHLPHVEKPEDVQRLIVQFCKT